MYTLYIADDEPLVIEGLRQCLNWQQMGIEIIGTACSGKVALEEIRTMQPDLAILDVKMPGLTGLEVISELQGETSTLFIVFSGYSEFEYVKKALDLEVVDYLIKPIETLEIEKTLLKALRRLESLRVLSRYDKYAPAAPAPRVEQEQHLSNVIRRFAGIQQYHAFICFQVGIGYRDFDSLYQPVTKRLQGLADSSVAVFCFPAGACVSVIVATAKAEQIKGARKRVELLLQSLSGEFGRPLYWGMGNAVFSLSELETSFSSASMLLDYSAFTGSSLANSLVRPLAASPLPQDFVARLSKCVVSLENDDVIRREFHQLLAQVGSGHTPQHIRLMCAELLYSLHNQIKTDLAININSILFRTDLSEDFFSVTTMEQLETWFLSVLATVREAVAVQVAAQHNGAISDIKAYVNQNLHRSINLQDIAEVTYMNPTYVSHIFK